MMNPIQQLVCLLLLVCCICCCCNVGSSQNVNVDFASFTLRNLTLLGDSYLRNGVIGLTREQGVPSSTSGSAIYNTPIRFFDPQTNITASFSTKFSFSIENLNPTSSFGDGLTFFLSPDNQTLGSPGGFLGLVNSSQLTKNRFIAVEFDTKLDLHFDDPDDNHVGLDIDSLISIKTANLGRSLIHLKSGNFVTTWIDYSNDNKKLQVFMSYSTLKPQESVLDVEIDLSGYFKEFMFVGFSASTEGSTEVHHVQNWGFQTLGFRHLRLNRNRTHPPYNVSDDSVPPVKVVMGSDSRSHRIGLGLGIGFPAFFFVLLVLLGFISVRKWRARTRIERGTEVLITGPKQFGYKELKSATRGFHPSRILGHGAFGTVYKAYFVETGAIAAVKRSKHSHEGKTEFLAELSIIACLWHKNLVQLLGWCVEKGELLLVYEFMPNGSLDNVLYHDYENGGINPLKWSFRYNIALGLASALAYLHQECEQQVIHRDIKTSNILLDVNCNARLGDFGLARLMDHGKSPVSTLTAGTMGYLAPEYLQYGTATDKTDVFSYGVVILELACGRRPIEREGETQRMVNLVDWVWRLYSKGNVVLAADERMKGEFEELEMKRLLLVGLSCANPDSSERPCMRRVFQILNNEAEPVMVPKVKPCLTFSNSLPLSINEIVSDFEESEVGIRVD